MNQLVRLRRCDPLLQLASSSTIAPSQTMSGNNDTQPCEATLDDPAPSPSPLDSPDDFPPPARQTSTLPPGFNACMSAIPGYLVQTRTRDEWLTHEKVI